jgi:hypothetical protein
MPDLPLTTPQTCAHSLARLAAPRSILAGRIAPAALRAFALTHPWIQGPMLSETCLLLVGDFSTRDWPGPRGTKKEAVPVQDDLFAFWLGGVSA